jgi:hypothetical protein
MYEVRCAINRFEMKLYRGIVPLVSALLLCGCSTFNYEWRQAAKHPIAHDELSGRWDGRWVSEVNGHNGKLRCLISPPTNGQYRARFHATYLRVLTFGYTVPLQAQKAGTEFQFQGSADLGRMAGGVYKYEGRAGGTNFFSTYSSKYDHGTFQMARPKE